jgi:hypothetical protein
VQNQSNRLRLILNKMNNYFQKRQCIDRSEEHSLTTILGKYIHSEICISFIILKKIRLYLANSKTTNNTC